jgi:hypothetical protein
MTSIDELVLQLNSPDTELSVEAARQLRLLSPEQIADLVRSAARLHTPIHGRAVKLAILSMIATLGLITALAIARSLETHPQIAMAAGMAIFALAVAWSYVSGQSMSECFRLLALHIGSQSDVRSVPAFLQLLSEEAVLRYPIPLKRGLQSSLKRTLPRLTESVYPALSPRDLDALAVILRTPYADSELAVAAIDVIGRLGIPHEPAPQAILHGLLTETAIGARMQAVQSAARSAVHNLEARKAAQQQSRSLLRPSDRRLTAGAGELLRSTAHAAPGRSDELLRGAPASTDAAGAIDPTSRMG